MRRCLQFACAALIALPLVGAQSIREVSFMVASPSSRPPVVDGALDDACWAEGVANTNYYTFIRRSETPRRVFDPRTECTVLYDAQCLYIGVRNWEKDTKSLRQHRIKDQDPDIWTDDSAELYFDPEAHGESFYRFTVNSLGKCDHLWRMDAANVHHEWVAEGAVAAARVFADRWEFELAVPWKSLRDVRCPAPGSVWTFDHNRYRFPGGEFDGLVDATRGMVSSPGASFTTPHMFGYLYFSDGRPPVAEAVLKEVASRAKGEWAIEIDGATYLHDASGTRKVAVPASEAIAARLAAEEAREKRYDELAKRLKAGEDGDYEPLPLPLAGTFDEKGPAAYDGFDGFYRQNASTGGYETAHFDWRASVGGDRPRVLFLTDYGSTMRDAVELAQRFPMDIDVYPGDFGDTGIYVDAVSRGGFIDKVRQFETFLSRKPDAIVLSGMPRAKIPSRYRYEMLRRIKKEGVGFLDIASDKSLDAPPLTPDWRADYERRAVRLWNLLRKARGLKPQAELEEAVERRIAAELSPAFGPLKFSDGPDSVPEGGTLTVTLTADKSFGEGERLEVFVRTSPYGELRARFDVAAAPGARTASFTLENRDFPTLAAVVEARRVSAAGEVAARAKKFFYFPNHRWTDYSLISWEGPGIAQLRRGAAGTMAPLYAPQLVEMAGYRNALLGDGPGSAVFNAHPLPYPCRVRFDPGPSNVTYWSTAVGLPARQRDRRRADMLKAMGKEINPYDPEVRKIMEESFENVVTNMVGYGVSAWSLGDECTFSIEAGNGPKDAAPFREFLAAKYGSIARYNALRGTAYRDFAEVPRPTVRESAAKGDVAAWWDHVQYMEKMYHDTMLFFADIVHRHDPEARVGAEGSVPGDLEKQIEGLMFWGPYRSLVNDELLRVIAPDRLRGIWWGGYFRCLRDGFPVQQWEYLLTGTLNADLWYDMYPGSVMGAFGGDFNPAPYFERMLPYLSSLRRGVAQLLIATPFREDGFAFHFSHPSARISQMSSEFSDPQPVLARLVRFCYRTGLAVDFTTPRRLQSLGRKKAVFLPATTVMSDAEVAAFRNFAENGGLLFADSEPGLLNEWMNRRESPPLKGLWRKFDPAVRDDEMAKLLSDAGVSARERISGLPPEETVFRVREGGGMRLVGFKTESRCLGADVDISLGSRGFVYAVDSGFVGRVDKVSLRKISVPFGLYAVFDAEQPPPSFAMPAQARQGEKVSWSTGALRRGGVYRFSVRTPSGAELGHREEVFTADGKPRSFTFALDDEAGPWRFTLRDIATGEEAVADTVCTAGDGGLVALARDGRALAAIVVAKDANKAARFAAADLKWHLDQITGGDFKIVEDDTPRTGFEILVGPSSRTKAKKGDYAFQEWGVKISSESIELVGLDREDKGRPTFSITERDGVTGSNWPWMYDEQGTMYAVYDFLERECGVVWANPSDYGTGIRKDPNLAVAPASRRGRPWMSYRGGAPLDREVVTPLDWKRGSEGERRYNEFAYAHPKAKGLQDKLYMLRNRLGGDFAKANHSFYWWYDRFWNEKSKTFEAFRPEYFAKGYDGQPPQLCYMNPEVVAKTVEDVRRYFDDAEFRRRHFNDTGRDHFIWGENNYCLEPMDNSSFCKCRDCSRLYEPERRGDNSMHSTYWFTFVNAVAREIGRSHPSKRITTLAYMSHEGLPRGVALEDNVTVYFCISANRMPNSANHPKQFARMAEWRRAYPRQPLAMWLYNCFPMEVARNGNWHCFPGFFAHEAERQYRFFMEQDIRGGVLHCGFVDNVDNYLQCKWMVDPSRRADDLLDEYFSIFGRAARPLRAFYDLVERRFCDKSLYPENSTHQTVKIAWGALGDGPTMERLAGYMDEAERLAETDLEKARVKEWRLSVWDYMREGRENYVRRSAAPKPEWKAVRVSAAGGDVSKVDWDGVPQFDAPLYFRGSDRVRGIREQVRICHDGDFLYLEITEWANTKDLMVCSVIVPCDVWEFVVERQEAQPYRYYMTGCDGRMDALSYGEVNWRQGVPSKESGLVNYGAKCVTDRTAPDHWTARWAFPLATLADAPLNAGDSFHLNCIRVACNAIGGPSDHWMFGIFSLTSFTTCHTCDRAGRVTLAK